MGACTMLRLPRPPSSPRPGLFPVAITSPALTSPQTRFVFPNSPIRHNSPSTPLPSFDPQHSLCEESPIFSTVMSPSPALKKTSVQVHILKNFCPGMHMMILCFSCLKKSVKRMAGALLFTTFIQLPVRVKAVKTFFSCTRSLSLP